MKFAIVHAAIVRNISADLHIVKRGRKPVFSVSIQLHVNEEILASTVPLRRKLPSDFHSNKHNFTILGYVMGMSTVIMHTSSCDSFKYKVTKYSVFS